MTGNANTTTRGAARRCGALPTASPNGAALADLRTAVTLQPCVAIEGGAIPLPHVDATRPALFAYDGSLEGLMTAVFIAYATHANVTDMCPDAQFQARLGQQVVAINTNIDAALRVRRGICNTCGTAVWGTIVSAAASDRSGTGTAIYRFIRHAMASGKRSSCSSCSRKRSCTRPCLRPQAMGILAEWANPIVRPVLERSRQVSNEAEKMRQFIRFSHVDDDFWYARCNPSASVVPFVMSWFSSRLNTQRFVIYDEAHRLAGLSSGGDWTLVYTDDVPAPPAAADEAQMRRAWKLFYRSLSIEARYNPELRQHFMPKRLWRNITEMQEELP